MVFNQTCSSKGTTIILPTTIIVKWAATSSCTILRGLTHLSYQQAWVYSWNILNVNIFPRDHRDRVVNGIEYFGNCFVYFGEQRKNNDCLLSQSLYCVRKKEFLCGFSCNVTENSTFWRGKILLNEPKFLNLTWTLVSQRFVGFCKLSCTKHRDLCDCRTWLWLVGETSLFGQLQNVLLFGM